MKGYGKMKKVKVSNIKEKAMEIVFLVSACISILSVALICVFLFTNGVPGIAKIGLKEFLLGTEWKPGSQLFGIMSTIIGSIYVTAGAIIVGVPIGLLMAVFMAKFCPKRLYKILKPGVELLAGIPSVVYGFFGLILIVPLIRQIFGGTGTSMLAACVLLGMMILPTIIGVTESAIRSVPESYYEGSLALGATKERSIFCVMLPAAKSGILAAVVLGIGRAIGETMAVVMVAGNQPRMPRGIFQGVRTLTANIVIEMGYASGLHREALIATGVVLFVFILLLNFCVALLNRGKNHE